MSDAIPTEPLMRYLRATPEQRAAIDRFLLGAAAGVGALAEGQVEVQILLDADAPILHGDGADGAAAGNRLLTLGRLEYRPGFADVWLEEEHFDLRQWDRARHCLAYLVKMRATTAATARHLVAEIDPYVRAQGGYPRAAAIRIDHYFNDRGGKVRRLFQEVIQAAGEGRYFLRAE